MAVQSIRAPVQVGDITRDHLLVPSRKMSLGKMDGVGELDHLAEEIRPRPKTLNDAGNLLPARPGSPEVIGSCSFACGFGIFRDSDLRARLWRGTSCFWNNRLLFVGHRLRSTSASSRFIHLRRAAAERRINRHAGQHYDKLLRQHMVHVHAGPGSSVFIRLPATNDLIKFAPALNVSQT